VSRMALRTAGVPAYGVPLAAYRVATLTGPPIRPSTTTMTAVAALRRSPPGLYAAERGGLLRFGRRRHPADRQSGPSTR
jgi:hypothetical protein